MDLRQLNQWLYRQRRMAHTRLRRWIQKWPPEFRHAVRHLWPVGRVLFRVLLITAQTVIAAAASPWVLLVDLFRRGKRVSYRWLLYVILIAIALGVSNWSLTRVINDRYQHSLTTLERYIQYTQDASAVQNVPYSGLINRYALISRIDPALLAAVVACESSSNPDAVSHAGACGLMQIMPATWCDLNPNSQCRGDHMPPAEGPGCIFDPEANISAGSRYLRELLDEFGDNAVQALAAYNAGRSTVTWYAATTGELPPYPETRSYLQNVTTAWSVLRSRDNLGNPWQPQHLRLWQDRASFSSLMLWGLAAAWVFLKLTQANQRV
ncbi:MAG: transglycosylase SLT domain-containing protein [Bacillota bacterium]